MSKELDDIISTTIRLQSGKVAENIINTNRIIEDMLKHMPKPPVLTPWEKLVRWVRCQPERVSDAWRFLKGDAAYIDWYDT